MELESPTETLCPLCLAVGDVETVQYRENKGGRPYFNCRERDTTVNLRGEDPDQYVRNLMQLQEEHTDTAGDPDPEDLAVDQPDDEETEESADTTTLADILAGNND